MRFFCSYFDVNYVPRALAMVRSLREHCPAFRLFVLCMDDAALSKVSSAAPASVVAIPLAELEAYEPVLLQRKTERTRVEYYYTCGPTFIRFVLAKFPEVGLLTYLDADLYFFSSPEPLFERLGDASVGLIEHRFSPRHLKRLQFGRFNVGWLSFRADACGLAALEWWAAQCIDWCFDRVEGDRFADQKYLDQLVNRFPCVRVLDHVGANVAPWNYVNYRFSSRGDQVMVDDLPLIFFHFHGFRELASWLVDSNLGRSFRMPNRVLRREVFGRYLNALRAVSPDAPRTISLRGKGSTPSLSVRLKTWARVVFSVCAGSYLIRMRGRIL